MLSQPYFLRHRAAQNGQGEVITFSLWIRRCKSSLKMEASVLCGWSTVVRHKAGQSHKRTFIGLRDISVGKVLLSIGIHIEQRSATCIVRI